jgi:hypothetical protein
MSDAAMVHVLWQQARPADEEVAVATILAHSGLVETTLTRLYPGRPIEAHSRERFVVRHLATGGAKRVYLVQAHLSNGSVRQFVLKQFLPIRLAYLPPGATVGGAAHGAADLDARLLAHMAWAAQRLDEVAPGLCPRFGGFWEWRDGHGRITRAMTEAYVEGESLERWKGILEDRFVSGELGFSDYTQRRLAMQRQAVAAYIRLWEALGRRTFTSDPSPWNVLFTPTSCGYRPVLIDLHSIHEGGTPAYVFQTIEERFGGQDEVRLGALCPAILDALGTAEGVPMLRAVSHELGAQATARERAGLSPFTASLQAIDRFLASHSLTDQHGEPSTCGP